MNRRRLLVWTFIFAGAVQQTPAQSPTLQDLPILTGIDLGPGLSLYLNTANLTPIMTDVDEAGSSLRLSYPGGQCGPSCGGGQPNYGFALFGTQVGTTWDLSAYKAMVLRISGDTGSSVEIAIQDAKQDKGTQTKVLISLSPQGQTYYIPLSWFLRADLKNISFPAQIIFTGSSAQTIHISQIVYTTQAPASGRILPHLTYGGGWYTALYFTNTSGASVPLLLNFFSTDGNPLYVPLAGNASNTVGVTVLLAPGGTSVVEFPNGDSTTVGGYAAVTLPPDVTGYALLRQSTQGQADQEALVPFSGTSATTATVIYDETKFVTSIAIVNPSAADANIAVFARDSLGNPQGQSTFFLKARTKQTFILKSLQGLGVIAGQRGSAQFVASSGSFALLALRSSGTSLTAIPIAGQ